MAGITIVLLLAVGLKGGFELAKQPFGQLLPQMVGVMVLEFFFALIAFLILRKLGRLQRADAASVAAHYGSVSVGTYAVVVVYLGNRQVSFEEHMPLLLVFMGYLRPWWELFGPGV